MLTALQNMNVEKRELTKTTHKIMNGAAKSNLPEETGITLTGTTTKTT
jgi:hypothetical protein